MNLKICSSKKIGNMNPKREVSKKTIVANQMYLLDCFRNFQDFLYWVFMFMFFVCASLCVH